MSSQDRRQRREGGAGLPHVYAHSIDTLQQAGYHASPGESSL